MLKRQESSLSSSSRQATAATPPPSEIHHAKAIGCMSGIFQLFSKYQNPNKRLTFGRKQEKLKPSSPKKTKKSPPAAKEDQTEKQTFDDRKRLTGVNVLRSPTIPPEIRRSIVAAATTPENSRTPPSPSLVARLMGLEDLGTASAARKAPAAEEDRFTAKRRRLLQSLEKCNDDLESLKRIIKAVQTADVRIQPPFVAAAYNKVHSGGGNAMAEETNIPAAVAEELTRSPPNSISIVQNCTVGATRILQQRMTATGKKPGANDEPIAKLLNKSTITESSLQMRWRAAAAVAQRSCSRAMVKSVEEVCGDIAWGEKREIGRIGLVLQDHLCRELIEELVKELEYCTIRSLPFEACKRRLCF